MKRIVTYIIFTALCCSNSYAQKLSLTDLTNLCNKKNWEDVNQTLLAKNWTYYDSEKGSTYKYNTITWSFNKDYYNDKAQGWFYLYTYEGFPNKISYSVFNKESYSLIQNSISTAGFKLVDSEIEDNEVTSTYGNGFYTLTISTEKRKDTDWSERSTTAYRITLIKKAGIYDEDNGEKTEYYYSDVVKMEYNLTNGKLNGQFKSYYENGNLKMTGNYLNGVKNGSFKEYSEDGIIEAEYSMTNGVLNGSLKTYYSNGKLKSTGTYLNGDEHGNFVEYDELGNKDAEYVMSKGLKNGVLKIYENGKLSYSNTFQNDIKTGQHIEYSYDDESGLLNLKLVGEYLNDEKNNAWKLFYIKDSKEQLLTLETYSKGIKNGAFQEIKGDSLIIGTYRNDEIHGKYRVYRDFSKMLFGGVIKTDTSKVTLITDGSYYEDLKSGYWKNYDLTNTLRSEGQFLSDNEIGEWKYYYTNWSDGKQGKMPYSQKLFLVQNFSNGKLDGKSTRYSYLNEEEYPCSEMDENKNPLDTCKRFVYKKVLETSFYKNGMLNGPFEIRDSVNTTIVKGNFKNDLKDGEWLHRYSEKDGNEEPYFIYQKGNYQNDKREGKWIQYYKEGEISESFNYQNGELHGEYIDWNSNSKPREIKQFNYGNLKELVTFDSLGFNKINKYEIYDEQYNSYKTRKTEFLESGYATQEYLVNKTKEIEHNWFELIFLIAINRKLSDGTEGYKDGLYGLYDSQSKPLVTGKFYKEERIDLWTFYNYDQDIKIESNFSKNIRTDEKYLKINGELFSGEFTFIDTENNIKEIRKIKDGLRNGKTIFKDLKTEKTIKKESYKDGQLK
jgi:antitoxin component YwqK of YwqJK toxin-antitoxin module